MQFTDQKKRIKLLLVVVAIFIAVVSLVISNLLVRDLAVEETHKVETWAEALKVLNNADGSADLTLVLKVLTSNTSIPVIAVDKSGNIQTYRNISIGSKDSVANLLRMLDRFKQENSKIRISLDVQDSKLSVDSIADYIDVYYDDSLMLKRLSFYPYIQLGVVLIFVVIAIFALLSSKRAEQNRVWVGLSKETAHQLGTPISSLMAWMEILKSTYPDDKLLPEMDNDVKRLQVIADRFSKIGFMPMPEQHELSEVVDHALDYVSHRVSSKVTFIRSYGNHSIWVKLNPSLFEWVIENLCKNAIDAMEGQGTVTVSLVALSKKVIVEVADTGKGIHRSNFKTIFEPGYTTKKRGWGLGLSLAKRIVEEYHKGRIYVKSSELSKGTVFRIELKK